jgi:hypothetical protein
MTEVQFPGADQAPDPTRKRRRSAWIVGAAALVAFLVWAGLRGPQDSSSSTTPDATGQTTTTTAAEAAPAGKGAPQLGRYSPASQRWAAGGTKTTRYGVPTGYPRTEDGAAAAATNYLVATASSGIHLDAKRWTDTAQAILVDPGSSEVEELHSQTVDYLESLGIDSAATTDLVSTFQPVSVSVIASSKDQATINVWGVSVFGVRSGTGGTGPVSAWRTWQLKVKWTDGDWHLENGLGEQVLDGPTPAPSGIASPAGDVVDAANGGSR